MGLRSVLRIRLLLRLASLKNEKMVYLEACVLDYFIRPYTGFRCGHGCGLRLLLLRLRFWLQLAQLEEREGRLPRDVYLHYLSHLSRVSIDTTVDTTVDTYR